VGFFRPEYGKNRASQRPKSRFSTHRQFARRSFTRVFFEDLPGRLLPWLCLLWPFSASREMSPPRLVNFMLRGPPHVPVVQPRRKYSKESPTSGFPYPTRSFALSL